MLPELTPKAQAHGADNPGRTHALNRRRPFAAPCFIQPHSPQRVPTHRDGLIVSAAGRPGAFRQGHHLLEFY